MKNKSGRPTGRKPIRASVEQIKHSIPINGFDNYRICRNGIVISKNNSRIIGWFVLRLSDRGNGYPFVVLYNGEGRHQINIHALLLKSFIGDCPEGCEARHLNGNRSDFSLSNLAWGTKIENMNDRDLHNRTAVGERNGNSKIDGILLGKMKALRARGFSFNKIARRFGISKSTAARSIQGKSWKHLAEFIPTELNLA